MTYSFLTDKFFAAYPISIYTQMETKKDRPYAHIHIDLNDYLFAIPLRSNINHPHAFFTNKKQRCGVDFSKSIVVLDHEYIDTVTKVFLRQDEFNKLRGKEFRLKQMLEDYIELYLKAKTDIHFPHRNEILHYSTLQYFEPYITNNGTFLNSNSSIFESAATKEPYTE